MPSADLLIENGWVITMDPERRVIPNGAVAVRKTLITAVGSAAEFSRWDVGRRIDAGGGIILPGLVNVHTHGAMTAFRGIADDLPLMTWLNEHIFPAEARLTPEKVYWGAMLACSEMILSGTTCFCDMYLFADAVARAARDAGMRAVVGEVLFDFPSPNYGPISAGFAYTAQMIAEWGQDPLITPAVEPHSPYLCAPELLQQACELARRHNIPLIIHLSETRSEVEQIKARFGVTPVGHLANLKVLGSNLLGCHCVMLTPGDIALLKAHDVKVAHCPESNMKLASGVAPIPDLVDAGVCVGLGTDGCASNNDLDLFGEMDSAAKLHKVARLDPTVMPAAAVLQAATIDGARALGLAAKIGSLEPGKQADVIVVDTGKPHLTPMYDPISHLVYAARGSDVAASIINGRVVMAQRQVLSTDAGEAMRKVAEFALEIRSGA